MKKILIIEDETGIRWSLGKALSGEFFVFSAGTIADARNLLRRETPDLILLDINLPDGNGVDFCRKLRLDTAVPIIILTVLGDEDTLISGLDAGADDYLTKPFSTRELLSRIHAVFRRIDLTNRSRDTNLTVGNYSLQQHTRTLTVESHGTANLTETEYRIVRLLMTAQGGLVTRNRILASLWDENNLFVEENTLSVNISRIRRKIQDAGGKRPIRTVRGVGYRFDGDT